MLMCVWQGPLVGEKKSSRAITEEYAKADPIYVAKTAVSNLRISIRATLIVHRHYPRNIPIIDPYLVMAIVDGGVRATPQSRRRDECSSTHLVQ